MLPLSLWHFLGPMQGVASHQADPKLRELKLEESARFSELSDIFNSDKINDIQNSDKLKIQYKPAYSRKMVPKCSHAPKDSKSHEKQLKHPFYKNSQRLDELLDQFLDRSIPDMISDPFGLDTLFKSQKDNKIHHNDLKHEKVVNTQTKSIIDDLQPKYPILRKLMQVEEDDIDIAYNDVNEVLSDDGTPHDDAEIVAERVKRNDDQLPNEKAKNPFSMNNPNWKAPILYPEELKFVIKQAALNNYRVKNTKNKEERDLNDMEYLEDYLVNEDNRLSKMAQAYSDYGVLEGRKDAVRDGKNSNIEKAKDHRVKLSVDVASIERFKKGKRTLMSISEGDEDVEDDYNENNDNTENGTNEDESFFVFDIDEKSTEDNFENTDSTYSMDDFIRIVNDTFEIHTPADDITDTNEATKFNTETLFTSDFYFENNENNTETTTDASLITTKFETHNYADIAVNKLNNNNTSDIFLGLIPNELKIANNYNNITETNSMGNKISNSNTTIDNYSNSFLKTDLENDESLSKKIMTNISDAHNITLINNCFNNLSLKANRTEETQKTLVKSDMLTDYNKTDSVSNEDKFKVQLNAKKDFNNKFKREIDKTEINYVTENMISNREQKFNNMGKFQNETNDFDFGGFFHMLSGIFASLDGIFVNENTSENKNNSSINILNITAKEYTENNSINTTANTIHLTNVTDEAIYPIYNTGMIGNIGHRSRVLLSVDDTSNATVIEKNTRDNLTNENEITKGDVTNTNITTSTNKLAKVNPLSNTTKPQKETKTVNNDEEQKSINKNKTVVKRNVDDSSLIFWNDLYDDEYGIKSDTIENIRDKHSIKDSNFIKSSKIWIENKKSKIDKRMIKIRDDDEQEVEKRDFAALTANMKEICKKAALAVKETRNLQVREDSRENAVATSLMDQLIKLMTDLVDYQVQQKTCLRLPADLQNFLQWLTGNESDSELDPSQKLYYRNDDVNADVDKPTEHDLDLLSSPSSEKEEIIPERSDCLGTLRDVQDLILLFDEMTEEDKRFYYTSHLHFISVQHLKNNSIITRDKRDEKKRQPRRKLAKFIKSFGKKHTRTTANYYDSLQFTESISRGGKKESSRLDRGS
ncbi:hypothetical protein K1T71_014072 [Dendrolimus kikuchii]|uniref:Uncharacterized protein n=1 Tax=Dendrolimus kikuchii TaxID=765133 RepID=A0ACC1CEY7_9NEOP|nr:hypothetical protein K1T71_014072 [Dendrolimus kikuchii]